MDRTDAWMPELDGDEHGLVTLTGEISSVIYTNEENGYSVVELDIGGSASVTAVGTIPYPGEGETVMAEGRFVNHAAYGSQLKCERIERYLPAEAGAIIRYLSSGAVKGVGPATARKIVEKFGIETFDILENRPRELLSIKGMTESRAENIAGEFATKLAIRSLMAFFSGSGIDMSVAMVLYKKHGWQSRAMVTENPYMLVFDPYFVPFHTIDALAQEFGIAHTAHIRLAAAVAFELISNQNQGHVCLPRERLVEVSARFLELPLEEIEDTVSLMENDKQLITEETDGRMYTYLPHLYRDETELSVRLAEFSRRKMETPPGASAALDELEEQFGIAFSGAQKEAILTAVSEPVMVLTGGPGTGKTTAVRGMLGLLDRMNARTLLAAPTGRAAKRLSELCGREAKTVHRLLQVQYTDDGLRFMHDLENPLQADAVIVDEMSMVDLPLMASLCRALPNHCRLILVGDPDQLASVGPGTVLQDIIRSGLVQTVHLDEIFRQALESDIIFNAHAVNHGERPRLRDNKKDFFFMQRAQADQIVETIADLCIRRLPEWKAIRADEIQIISPTRNGACGTRQLNPILRDLINPPSPHKAERAYQDTVFREGDRVMQVRNNYDIPWKREPGDPEWDAEMRGVFNGDIGVVKQINPTAQTLTVAFVDKTCDYSFDLLYELEHAYAITVHKAQGSEFKTVLFIAASTNPKLMTRNLFYTGITRARELLVIVGTEDAVDRMVVNSRRLKRYSCLFPRLYAEAVGGAV